MSLLLALAILFLLPVSSFGERVEDLPKPTDYVSDFAHVLSPQTVAQLDRLCGQLDHSKTNAQVAIVIVHNLDGDDKSDFANRLEEKWKVGKKGSDRGILMLLSVDDHHYWIEVGYGLEGILPDAKVGDIGRLMLPDLKRRDYDTAVTTGAVQIANVIAADAKVTLNDPDVDPNGQAVPHRQPQPSHLTGSALIRIIILLIVVIFLVVRFLGRFGLFFLGGPWLGGGGGGWGGGGGGGSSGGDGFGGFGGGESGGGGAGGDW